LRRIGERKPPTSVRSESLPFLSATLREAPFFSWCKSRQVHFRKGLSGQHLRRQASGVLHHPPPHKWSPRAFRSEERLATYCNTSLYLHGIFHDELGVNYCIYIRRMIQEYSCPGQASGSQNLQDFLNRILAPRGARKPGSFGVAAEVAIRRQLRTATMRG
jgi:hypothetical protein